MAVSPERATKVYALLAATPAPIMPHEIVKETGLARRTVYDAIYDLTRIGAVKRQGRGNYVCVRQVSEDQIEAELTPPEQPTDRAVSEDQIEAENKLARRLGERPHPIVTALGRVEKHGWSYCNTTGRVTHHGMERRPVDLVNAANRQGGKRIAYPGAA